MLQDHVYEGMSNKRTYDNIREYCITEGVDEEFFRASTRHEKQGRKNASIRTTSDSKYIENSGNPTKKRGTRTVTILIAVMIFILGVITIFFYVPYSKTHAEFISLTGRMLKDTPRESGVFTEGDILHLPYPVKKYFHYCGYMDTTKMTSMKVVYKNVTFLFGKGMHPLTIDYTQYNNAIVPTRIAYIDSAMYGIPFEGIDSYSAGKGAMKGVLAKLFTLFSQAGNTMDRASQVTFLSECLIFPNAALQDYITWEEVDTLHAKATISCFGGNVSGIFAFNDTGEMVSFTTDDREATSADGKSEKVRWSIILSDYQETDKIKKPTGFQAIWHYETGDLLYFDGENVSIEFDPQLM